MATVLDSAIPRLIFQTLRGGIWSTNVVARICLRFLLEEKEK